MQPPGPTSGIPALPARPAVPASNPPLQVGQLLQATVLENDAGKLLLALGHRQLAAESSLPLRPGEVLTLEVRSLGEQPVLKLITALQASATAAAVRMLLPRYGPTTPLLSTLPQLAQAPAGSLPAPLAEAVRALLRQLPERASLGTAQGVKTAIARSGSFTEQQLLQTAGGSALPDALQSDFKANLLRLLAQLRAQPAGSTAQPEGRPSGSAPPAGANAAPPPAQASARIQTETPQPSGPPADAGRAAPAGQADAAGKPHSDTLPASLPQAVKYALAAGPAAGARGVAAGLPGTPATAGTGGQTGTTPAPGAAAQPPPPFAGAVPTPQSPVKAALDLMKDFAHLRPELLQQTEAALVRIHLNQLASLPRDGDHRLVEWLFDIPVRRGEDVDLWSARLHRDAQGHSDDPEAQQSAWHVQLAFDLPGLGPMQASVSIRGEQVSTRFHCMHPQTLPLVDSHLPELRRALLDAGLEVGTLDCHAGAIAGDATATPDTLIDEQA